MSTTTTTTTTTCTMQDCGLVAVDCVVVCCCCPCLALQVTIFLLITLPHKLVVKSKRVVLRKLHQRRLMIMRRDVDAVEGKDVVSVRRGGALFVAQQGHFGHFVGREGDINWFCDRGGGLIGGEEEVWKGLVEEEGLFWFGSFWANGV